MSCSPMPAETGAAEEAMWECAGSAVDTALVTLLLSVVLLMLAQLILLWLTLS